MEHFAEKYNHIMTAFDGVNEGGVLSRSDDKIPQYVAEHSMDIEPQWLQEIREESKNMLAKYDDQIKKLMEDRKTMAEDFDSKINLLILKWKSIK
jgi:hypothetical protein